MTKKYFVAKKSSTVKNDFHASMKAVEGEGTSKDPRLNIIYGVSCDYEPEWFPFELLHDSLPEWVPADLRLEMYDSLIGFNRDMAVEIADNLIDCLHGLYLHATGIQHVDNLLWQLYAKILNCANEKGVQFKSRD